jgi:transcriptional regulator with XRE-family HTH domain
MNVQIDPLEQYVIDFVRKLRVENRLRQQDIADILNTSSSFIGNVENRLYPAKYNLKHINVLAGYFNLSPRSFLPDKPIPNNRKKKIQDI